MNILALFMIVVYLLALFLRWYQNYSMVGGWPFILGSMTRRSIFMVALFILTYGSIIAIGYFYGLPVGLAALVIRMIVGRLSFSHYFRDAVREHAEWEYQQMLKDRAIAKTSSANVDVLTENPIDRLRRTLITLERTDSMDESAMRQEAYRRAHQAIQSRVMRG